MLGVLSALFECACARVKGPKEAGRGRVTHDDDVLGTLVTTDDKKWTAPAYDSLQQPHELWSSVHGIALVLQLPCTAPFRVLHTNGGGDAIGVFSIQAGQNLLESVCDRDEVVADLIREAARCALDGQVCKLYHQLNAAAQWAAGMYDTVQVCSCRVQPCGDDQPAPGQQQPELQQQSAVAAAAVPAVALLLTKRMQGARRRAVIGSGSTMGCAHSHKTVRSRDAAVSTSQASSGGRLLNGGAPTLALADVMSAAAVADVAAEALPLCVTAFVCGRGDSIESICYQNAEAKAYLGLDPDASIAGLGPEQLLHALFVHAPEVLAAIKACAASGEGFSTVVKVPMQLDSVALVEASKLQEVLIESVSDISQQASDHGGSVSQLPGAGDPRKNARSSVDRASASSVVSSSQKGTATRAAQRKSCVDILQLADPMTNTSFTQATRNRTAHSMTRPGSTRLQHVRTTGHGPCTAVEHLLQGGRSADKYASPPGAEADDLERLLLDKVALQRPHARTPPSISPSPSSTRARTATGNASAVARSALLTWSPAASSPKPTAAASGAPSLLPGGGDMVVGEQASGGHKWLAATNSPRRQAPRRSVSMAPADMAKFAAGGAAGQQQQQQPVASGSTSKVQEHAEPAAACVNGQMQAAPFGVQFNPGAGGALRPQPAALAAAAGADAAGAATNAVWEAGGGGAGAGGEQPMPMPSAMLLPGMDKLNAECWHGAFLLGVVGSSNARRLAPQALAGAPADAAPGQASGDGALAAGAVAAAVQLQPSQQQPSATPAAGTGACSARGTTMLCPTTEQAADGAPARAAGMCPPLRNSPSSPLHCGSSQQAAAAQGVTLDPAVWAAGNRSLTEPAAASIGEGARAGAATHGSALGCIAAAAQVAAATITSVAAGSGSRGRHGSAAPDPPGGFERCSPSPPRALTFTTQPPSVPLPQQPLRPPPTNPGKNHDPVLQGQEQGHCTLPIAAIPRPGSQQHMTRMTGGSCQAIAMMSGGSSSIGRNPFGPEMVLSAMTESEEECGRAAGARGDASASLGTATRGAAMVLRAAFFGVPQIAPTAAAVALQPPHERSVGSPAAGITRMSSSSRLKSVHAVGKSAAPAATPGAGADGSPATTRAPSGALPPAELLSPTFGTRTQPSASPGMKRAPSVRTRVMTLLDQVPTATQLPVASPSRRRASLVLPPSLMMMGASGEFGQRTSAASRAGTHAVTVSGIVAGRASASQDLLAGYASAGGASGASDREMGSPLQSAQLLRSPQGGAPGGGGAGQAASPPPLCRSAHMSFRMQQRPTSGARRSVDMGLPVQRTAAAASATGRSGGPMVIMQPSYPYHYHSHTFGCSPGTSTSQLGLTPDTLVSADVSSGLGAGAAPSRGAPDATPSQQQQQQQQSPLPFNAFTSGVARPTLGHAPAAAARSPASSPMAYWRGESQGLEMIQEGAVHTGGAGSSWAPAAAAGPRGGAGGAADSKGPGISGNGHRTGAESSGQHGDIVADEDDMMDANACAAMGTAGGWVLPEQQPVVWHRVHVSARSLPVPVGGEGQQSRVLLLLQQDVTAETQAQERLAVLLEHEFKLLEALFPRHVLEYLTSVPLSAQDAPDSRRDGRARKRRASRDRTVAGSQQKQQDPDLPLPQQQQPAPGTRPGVRWASTVRSTRGGDSSSVGPSARAAARQLHEMRRQRELDAHKVASLATRHKMVTILYSDIVGFTAMCKQVTPLQVMSFLNEFYKQLDALLDVYRVYKVETIGDCYMVCGGLMRHDADGFRSVLPEGQTDELHAVRVLAFAKAMLRISRTVKLPTDGQPVQVRIGLHSGPVMSGMVGSASSMPRFCLFGGTVDTAHQVEARGRPGRIHVSAATRALLGSEAWEATGVSVEADGQPMPTYLWREQNDSSSVQRVAALYL